MIVIISFKSDVCKNVTFTHLKNLTEALSLLNYLSNCICDMKKIELQTPYRKGENSDSTLIY